MTLDEAHETYDQMKRTQDQTLLHDLARLAIRYARIRVDWLQADQEGRTALKESRTNAHTAFLDACNILSRAMGRNGEDNRWRERLGDDRKALGDFACHLHCLLGLQAR